MSRPFQTRCLILCAALVGGLSLLSVRLIQIQLVDRKKYAEGSLKAYHRVEKLPAMRGMIVDRREEPLAKSIPVTTVFVDKNHLQDPKLASFGLAFQEAQSEPGWEEKTPEERSRRIRSLRGDILLRETADAIVEKHLAYAVGILARPLGMRREELRARIEESKGKWVPIAKELPEDVADKLREAVDQNMVQGFEFQNSIKRWYTAEEMATHVIGFTGEITEKDEHGTETHRVVGRFGVEAAMEEYLAGRDGWRVHRRNARGLVVPGDTGSLRPPRAGLNVQLTLDMGLQAIVEEELDVAMAEFRAEKAAVVLIDPMTGEVLAMASRPHFNLNRRDEVAANGFNYAIQATNEPGSTIKIVPTSAAINERLATPQTSIFCHNGYFQEGPVWVKDQFPQGTITLETVLQKSNNIGAYKFGRQVGASRYYDYLRAYGFGSRTGILLSGESPGIVRNTGNPMDFSRTTYGYALTLTPLQLACAYAVIGGDGCLREPRIVRALIANDGTVVESFAPKIVREVLKPRVAEQMRTALEKVVAIGGTATRAAVPGYRVAGKTGTAQKAAARYSASKKVVSFAGMMPAQNPAFVCAVVVDEPKPEGFNAGGGTVAAPIFQRIAARAAARMNLQPTEVVPPSLASSPSR